MSTHTTRSQEEKNRLIKAFKNRGSQTADDFFKENGLSNSILYAWMGKVKGKTGLDKTGKSGSGKYDAAFKAKVFAALAKGDKSKQDVAKDFGIHASNIYYWKTHGSNGAGGAPKTGHDPDGSMLTRVQDALIFLKRAEQGFQLDLSTGAIKKEKMWHLQMKLARATLEGS